MALKLRVLPRPTITMKVLPNSVGPEGPTGPQGPNGPEGPQGIQGPQGDPWTQWRGTWLTATTYVVNDAVEHGGSSYIATAAHTSDATTEPGVGAGWATAWDLIAQKGMDGSGTGDMLAATYDPGGIAADAFARSNHTGTLALNQGGTGATTATGARTALGANDAGNLDTGTLLDARVSATLTADKAFRRGNILGTVSQSAGTPTGEIIERGSNANGNYVRFADGTQICWHAVTTGLIDNASGNIFIDVGVSWTFPAAFSVAPTISGAADRASGSGATWLVSAGFGVSTTAVSTLRAGGSVSGATAKIHVVAIGRWF